MLQRKFAKKPKIDISYSLLSKFICSLTDTQFNCLKNNFKIYSKIDIKTAPTCFSAVTPSTLASANNVLPDDGVTGPKHVEAILRLILM
jgi:hypothetical protein